MSRPTMNILLVDDDEVDRLAVARALRFAGLDARLKEVETMSAALVALKEQAFDCVLLDYQLPEGDALDVLRALRESGLDTPVVILTGHGSEQTAVALMKAGAADYLPKNALSADRLAQSLRYATERRRLQKERDELLIREQQARHEAEVANATKDQFLAILSHELRTPLNAILGWVRMLQAHQLDPDRIAHALSVIERNAQAQAALINDLLDVSRIVAGKLDLARQRVDPAAICVAAIETLRPQLDEKHIKLDTAFEPDAGPVVGDPSRLQQVVLNLLSNAIKFSSPGGVIRITLRRLEGSVELVVEDHGAGVDPEFLPRIFERFSQGLAHGGSSRGGLGLGLAIVRSIVELHGGTVRAESDGQGHGARFTVLLPAGIKATGPTPPASSARRPAEHVNGVRVLFIDDSVDARDLVRAILEEHGARVTTSDSKDAALAALERERPDVLISDIEMPDGTGYEMIRALRLREADTTARIPAIALTATTRAEDRIRMLSAGFQLLVPKPVDPAELVAAVAALAGRRRGRQPRS